MKLEFHHLGYAVKSIEKSLEVFEILGFSREGSPEIDERRKVRIQFIRKDGISFELIEPAGEGSPVEKILQERGSTPYHFCMAAENIEEIIEILKGKRFVLIEKPGPAKAIEDRRVTFLYHNEIGILELVEV